MSPRSERSSGSLPSKPPALISTPTSSPTPFTVTVTAPPATVPSTVVSLSRAWASWSCSCICWACWSRAFMSKPPAPPSASNGFWVMVRSPLGSGGCSLVADLLDHPGAELALEQLGPGKALVVGVDVVGMRVGVGGGQVVGAAGVGAAALPGLLDGGLGGGDRLRSGLLACGRRGLLGRPGLGVGAARRVRREVRRHVGRGLGLVGRPRGRRVRRGRAVRGGVGGRGRGSGSAGRDRARGV